MRPQAGQVINNKYRLLRLIGDGGMGSVYEARHEILGTTVALKFLHPELSRRENLVRRFLQEARVSAQIQSPHIVNVIDVDQQPGGLAYIVMEYLEGSTLQSLYEQLYHAGKRLSYPDAMEYAMQMLEGVEAAHRADVVHRDLKPDNVIITKGKRGEPLLKILDFGIAKLKVTGQLDRGLTRPGVVMGTPEYMAPEQAFSADTVDARADIFSLGVIIFEMLAGRRPVGGDEPQQIATAYMTGQISKLNELAPHLDPALVAAVHKAIAPQPPNRFASVAEFRSALEPFANALKAGTPGAPQVTPVQSAVTPSPAISPAIAAAATPPAAAVTPPAAAIPQTIAPEDEARTAAIVSTGTALAEPASAAMGASPDATVEAQPYMANQAAPAEMPPGAPPPNAGGLPPTVDAAPYMAVAMQSPPPETPAQAAAFQPTEDMPGGGKTTPGDAPMAMPVRPGGTDIGAIATSPYAATAPAEPFVYQPSGAAAPLPGTAAMDPIPVPMPGPVVQPPERKEKRGGGTSIFSMLVIASAVTAMVLGGLYLVQRFQQRGEGTEGDDSSGVIAPPPPPVSLPQDTGTATEPPPPTTTQAPPPPPTTAPKPTGTTPKPTGTPSTTTSAPPTASSNKPTIPPPFIPSQIPTTIVIPSVIPLPGIPTPNVPTSKPTNTSPQPTNTSPQPTTTNSRRIPIPKFGIH